MPIDRGGARLSLEKPPRLVGSASSVVPPRLTPRSGRLRGARSNEQRAVGDEKRWRGEGHRAFGGATPPGDRVGDETRRSEGNAGGGRNGAGFDGQFRRGFPS